MIIKLRCNYCGAETEIPSDIIGIKCEYCGSPIIHIPDKYKQVLNFPNTLTIEESLTRIRKFLLNKVGQGYTIHSYTEFTIPIWRGIAKGKFNYEGYKKHIVTKTIKTNKSTTVKTETYYIPINRTTEVNEWIAIPGRINEDIYALDEILQNSLKIREYTDAENMVKNGWEIVIPELSREEAINKIDDEAEERLYNRALKEVDELLDYNAHLYVDNLDLVYYPVIEFTYLFKKKRYRGVFDPVIGEVIRCEIPIKKTKRILYATLAYTILILLVMLIANIKPAPDVIIPTHLILGLGAGGFGAYMIYRATAPQEVYD